MSSLQQISMNKSMSKPENAQEKKIHEQVHVKAWKGQSPTKFPGKVQVSWEKVKSSVKFPQKSKSPGKKDISQKYLGVPSHY